MSKKKKQKILILVLAIALVGAIILLGFKSGFVDRVFFGNYTEYDDDGFGIVHSDDTKNSSDYEKSDDSESKGKKSNKKTKDPHGKKKDIGGGLYLYEDGTIETEIMP